ncbi:MAG TPA: hypothetical protein DIW23_15430 [Anaerolineae bacterium]|nr:hypothetical protein [Anaerolineae bacterium]
MYSIEKLGPIGKSDFNLWFEAINKFLDFKKWNFKLINPGFMPIFYESPRCKVMFLSFRDSRDEYHSSSPEISVSYARSHAPLDSHYINFDGKMYRCWHDIRLLLCYLEGMNPKKMLDYYHQTPSSVLKKFNASRKPEWSQEEYVARFHSLAWDKYGNELFDLLDINQPELWKGYSDFVFDFYKTREERATLKTKKKYTIDSYYYNVC